MKHSPAANTILDLAGSDEWFSGNIHTRGNTNNIHISTIKHTTINN
jgi:hypothetical protein